MSSMCFLLLSKPLLVRPVDPATILRPTTSCTRGGNEVQCVAGEKLRAEYPSGLRGRIANPLFVGSNPTSAFYFLRYPFTLPH